MQLAGALALAHDVRTHFASFSDGLGGGDARQRCALRPVPLPLPPCRRRSESDSGARPLSTAKVGPSYVRVGASARIGLLDRAPPVIDPP
jgi:hypothetical protein